MQQFGYLLIISSTRANSYLLVQFSNTFGGQITDTKRTRGSQDTVDYFFHCVEKAVTNAMFNLHHTLWIPPTSSIPIVQAGRPSPRGMLSSLDTKAPC